MRIRNFICRGVFFLTLFVSTFLYGQGTIIVLNGPSASGKSSVQRQVQVLFAEPYLKVGIDNFFDALLPDEFAMGVAPQGNFTQEMLRSGVSSVDAADKPVLTLHVRPLGEHVIAGMHDAFAAYAKHGNNLVIDYIAYEKQWLGELACALEGYKVYLVGVKTPLSVIEAREKARATSPVGHARSHYDSIHTYGPKDSEFIRNVVYDLEIDTAVHSPEECARIIDAYVNNNPKPQALKTLRKQYLADLGS